MLGNISLVKTINKYVYYLSASPKKKHLSPDACFWPVDFFSANTDKYLIYFWIVLTRLIFPNIFRFVHLFMANEQFTPQLLNMVCNLKGPSGSPGRCRHFSVWGKNKLTLHMALKWKIVFFSDFLNLDLTCIFKVQ